MAKRAILRFPDARLRMAAETIAVFDGALAALADDLTSAMRAAPGIGITAPHIGVLQRLVAIEFPAADRVRIYVNPRIEWASAALARHEEGSVSMPGVTEIVERPACVRVAFQNLTGAPRVEEADGLLAVCLQHEIDQLDGMFWIQRLSKLKRDRLVRRFEKMGRPG